MLRPQVFREHFLETLHLLPHRHPSGKHGLQGLLHLVCTVARNNQWNLCFSRDKLMLVVDLEVFSNVGTYPVDCLGHYSASTGIRFISERYQANARLSPSSNSIFGSQPNSFRALEKSPQLLGISTRRASGFQ